MAALERADGFKNAIINVRQGFYLEGKEFAEHDIAIMNEILGKEEDWFIVAHKNEFDGI